MSVSGNRGNESIILFLIIADIRYTVRKIVVSLYKTVYRKNK